jgi:hypothetical protein
LVEELRMHLAGRWFTGLGFDQEISHHSTFSKNRHGRFQESKLFEQLFEQMVRQCVEVGLVKGEDLSVDGSFVEANAAKQSRIAHGANANDSSCSRPACRQSRFLQRSPSLRATACSWFMIRVRACTIRCRCHSSCRRSRFSQLGTQISGKRSSISSCRISRASYSRKK